jgi:hypothetical protein
MTRWGEGCPGAQRMPALCVKAHADCRLFAPQRESGGAVRQKDRAARDEQSFLGPLLGLASNSKCGHSLCMHVITKLEQMPRCAGCPGAHGMCV